MKRIARNASLYLGLGFYSMAVSAQQKPLARIQISNPSSLARGNEIAEMRFSELEPLVKQGAFRLIETTGRQEIPYQLEYRGSPEPVNVLILINILPPGQVLKLDVMPGQPASPEVKTFARYVPERKDDFAWENDRVAFRMYGKALETASDNATGTDIWSKRTDKLVLNKWYQENDYHSDKGEGMDYYQVGITLGAGDIAPYYKDSIILSKNYHRYKVLDNGPLRSTFRLEYDSWRVGNLDVSATKTISLDAGSQLNRVEINYDIKGAGQTEVVAGIVKRSTDSPVLLDQKNGIIGYWEPEVKDKGIMGIGLITSKPHEIKSANGHFLSHMTIRNKVPLVYYNGGAWNRAGKITNSDEWFKYLKNYQYKIENPLVVRIEN